MLRHGETPLSVTAAAQTDKPGIYSKVEDDATVIVSYPKMQAVLMPSWTQAAAPALPESRSNSLGYLAAVLHGEIKPEGDLSSLDTNMVVMQILDAARTSAASGRTVALKPLL